MKRGFYSALLFFALCSFIGHNLYTHQHHELILSADHHHHHHHHHHHDNNHHSPHSVPDSDLDHDLEFGKILFKTQPVSLNFGKIQPSLVGIDTRTFIVLLSSNREISGVVFKPDEWYLSPGFYSRIADRAPPI